MIALRRLHLIAIAMLSACAPADRAELLQYVPADAEAVFVADPAVFANSRFFVEIDRLLVFKRQYRIDQLPAAADACGIGSDRWSGFVFVNNFSAPQKWLIAIRGKNVGEQKALECVADRLRAQHAGEWRVKEQSGYVSFDDDAYTRGRTVGDDVLLIYDKDYGRDVTAVLDGVSKSATEGEVARRLAGVDRTKAVYFASGPIPGVVAETLPGLESIAGTLDVSTGLAADVTFTFSDPDQAKTNAEQLAKALETAKGFLTASGISTAPIDSVELEIKDATVSGRGSMTEDELGATAAALAD